MIRKRTHQGRVTEIEWRIEKFARKHPLRGPLEPQGKILRLRFPDGWGIDVDEISRPPHYKHGGILYDMLMEKLGGDPEWLKPK